MTEPIREGRQAPNFKLPLGRGKSLSLKELRGRQVVLYFYPKDFTEGCTVEACEFAKADEDFKKAKAVVLGISPDPPERHAKFAEKYGLPFKLLSDEKHAVAVKYGVWGEKKLYGRVFEGVHRSTFLIDEEGRVAKVWPKAKAAGHAQEVLRAIQQP